MKRNNAWVLFEEEVGEGRGGISRFIWLTLYTRLEEESQFIVIKSAHTKKRYVAGGEKQLSVSIKSVQGKVQVEGKGLASCLHEESVRQGGQDGYQVWQERGVDLPQFVIRRRKHKQGWRGNENVEIKTKNIFPA